MNAQTDEVFYKIEMQSKGNSVLSEIGYMSPEKSFMVLKMVMVDLCKRHKVNIPLLNFFSNIEEIAEFDTKINNCLNKKYNDLQIGYNDILNIVTIMSNDNSKGCIITIDEEAIPYYFTNEQFDNKLIDEIVSGIREYQIEYLKETTEKEEDENDEIMEEKDAKNPTGFKEVNLEDIFDNASIDDDGISSTIKRVPI